MKVFFLFDIAFPKGRISRKNGNAEIECKDEMSIEERKSDNDLKSFLALHINRQYKTGKVINVEITNIEENG